MDERDKGFYSAVEKEILILVDTIESIIERTNMAVLNAGMVDSIRLQMFTDREIIRRHASLRNKVAYKPVASITLDPDQLKDLNEQEIEQIYDRMEAVYFSLVKFEQASKK
jgi:hypothetical protein